MKRLFIVTLALAVLALSCGQARQNMGATSDLGLMLSAVPSELGSNNVLWFNNMERIKELAGVGPDTDANEFVNKMTEIEVYRVRINLLAGYTLSNFSGGIHLERWQDAFGFDAFDSSQEIWGTSLAEPSGVRPTFSVMKGDFDKDNIIGKLKSLGYQLKEHSSIDYYSIRADYQPGDMRSSNEARMAMSYLNRMMVKGQEIIASPVDEVFFSILEVRSGKESSLKDSLAYTRVAEVLGDVLGAALIPYSQLRSENLSLDWGSLHDYDLAGIGYHFEGQERKIVITLHYPDKSASEDKGELKSRMAEYELINGGLKTSRLSDLFNIGDPEAVSYDIDSILKVELVYQADVPRGFEWSALVEMEELGFLVSNPSR